MLIMLVFRTPILLLLGANEASLKHASDYYTWIALGIPFIVFSMIPNNQLRTEGLASFGMWGAVAGSVANIILDPIFIFVLNMGAGGAALATSLSNVLSCILYILIIRKKCKVMTININVARKGVSRVAEVLRIGIPASVTNIMNSLCMMITNRALEPFGNERIAAMGISMKINMICLMTLIGFAIGGQPLFGYTYGSRDTLRFRKTLRFAYIFELLIGSLFAVSLYVLAPFLMKSFMDETEVVNAGISMLRFMQISSVLIGFSLVTTCVCQAVGNASGALILSLSRQGIVFWITITVLTRLLGFNGILLAQPTADLITGIISCFIIYGILKKFKEIMIDETESDV